MGIDQQENLMFKKKFLLSMQILILFSVELFSNDYSFEANYIFKNHVEISIIDSFFFKSNHPFEEKKFVTLTLINYESENAKNLFLKLLNDDSIENQSLSIIPLINVGEFQKGLNKLKKLLLNNNSEVIFNLYNKNYLSPFTIKKLELFKKYQSELIPLLKRVCISDSISYEIKIEVANTLYYLDEKEQLMLICNEILENIPDPSLQKMEYKDYSKEEEMNWHLRYKAKWKLKSLYQVK